MYNNILNDIKEVEAEDIANHEYIRSQMAKHELCKADCGDDYAESVDTFPYNEWGEALRFWFVPRDSALMRALVTYYGEITDGLDTLISDGYWDAVDNMSKHVRGFASTMMNDDVNKEGIYFISGVGYDILTELVSDVKVLRAVYYNGLNDDVEALIDIREQMMDGDISTAEAYYESREHSNVDVDENLFWIDLEGYLDKQADARNMGDKEYHDFVVDVRYLINNSNTPIKAPQDLLIDLNGADCCEPIDKDTLKDYLLQCIKAELN